MEKTEFLQLAFARIDKWYGESHKVSPGMKEFTDYGVLSHFYRKEWAKFKIKTLEEQRDRVFKLIAKNKQRKIDKYITAADEVFSAELPDEITISVEWKKSRMWGYNPTCTIRVCYKDNTCDTYRSGSISGCGYDKESTAIAQACVQSPSITRLLFVADQNDKPKDLGQYGYHRPGDGYMPHLNGGVGTSCFPFVFELAGYQMVKVASGNSYDAWIVNKKS